MKIKLYILLTLSLISSSLNGMIVHRSQNQAKQSNTKKPSITVDQLMAMSNDRKLYFAVAPKDVFGLVGTFMRGQLTIDQIKFETQQLSQLNSQTEKK